MRARIFGMIVVALLGAFQSAAAGPIEDARAVVSDASIARAHGDYATALRLLLPLAQQGHPKAQLIVGMLTIMVASEY